MSKRMALLLLLLTVNNVYAMSWFGYKKPYCHAAQSIQDMHADKSAFEHALKIEALVKEKYSDEVPPVALIVLNYIKNTRSWGLSLLLRDFPEIINTDSDIFLLYCYHQQYHEKQQKEVADYVHLLDYPVLFTKCMQARINGYSALGAAIIAPNIAQKYKREFIERLMKYGFTMTAKDKKLLALAVYDALMEDQREKQKTICLLGAQATVFSLLPLDVRKYIVAQMVLLIHKEYGLL